VKDKLKYVSRGGLKLEKAIKAWDLDFSDKLVLDIGASTGGFTDCALQNGAVRVYSVDVGTNQLDWRLKNDERVVSIEETHIKDLTTDDMENNRADFIVICTNTMHKVVSGIKKYTKLPILHIAEMTAEKILEKGLKNIALLGTKYTMEQDFYKSKLIEKGINVIIPDKNDIETINEVIYDEICLGIINSNSKKKFLEIVDKLRSKGAEGIILGCTEIGLLIKNEDTDVPLFDTAIIHAEQAAIYSIK